MSDYRLGLLRAAEIVETGAASFDGDPADTEFQRGYQAALDELLVALLHEIEGEAA